MAMMQHIAAGKTVLSVLSAGLEREFGQGVGAALAARFLEAEESDFLWEARISERWLGRYWSADEEGSDDLDRVAILARLGRAWSVAVLIIDGEGCAHGLMGRRDFRRKSEAARALASLR